MTVEDPNPPYPSDTRIPSTPGHYTSSQLLGFKAPGVSFNIQVTKIPGR